MGADSKREGWQGWDQYAPFYDWENARTWQHRDLPFWRHVAKRSRGPVLELGAGTGRVSLPLAQGGIDLIGVDRSAAMLARAVRAARAAHRTLKLLRGDIRMLPFPDGVFSAVLAPYGVLQSLIRPRDLDEALTSVARVIRSGGTFGVDLVPDVPNWREYRNQVRLRGRSGGAAVTLIESVRQDRRRGLTTFEHRYIERRGHREAEHRFDLTFRTLKMPEMARELERAGFVVESMLGDYRGRPWDRRAEVWIILAKKR
jgi:SAM-dependent methyltransferase